MIEGNKVVLSGFQRSDNGLTSLAALEHEADSFIKAVGGGGDTYELRTMAEVRTDLSLNSVENTAISSWAGSGNITTVGALASGSIAAGFTEIAVDYTDAKCTDATADNTAGNETSHIDVVVDGDFGSNGILNRTGAGAYSILALGTDVQAYHANLAAIVAGTWTGANSITTLGTIATGTWQSTDVAILHGGTGQSTAQAAIDALTAVSGATNEHVLTKDTATGNATWKAASGGHSYVDRGDPATHDFDLGDLTTDGGYYTLDLSGIVPEGAIAVSLLVYLVDDLVTRGINFRKNGQSNLSNRFSVYNQVANVGIQLKGSLFCDTNRVIEYMTSNVTFTTINITVCGWWI